MHRDIQKMVQIIDAVPSADMRSEFGGRISARLSAGVDRVGEDMAAMNTPVSPNHKSHRGICTIILGFWDCDSSDDECRIVRGRGYSLPS